MCIVQYEYDSKLKTLRLEITTQDHVAKIFPQSIFHEVTIIRWHEKAAWHIFFIGVVTIFLINNTKYSSKHKIIRILNILIDCR